MYISAIIIPKQDVVLVCDEDTIEKAIEIFKKYKYSEIPVISQNNKYIGALKSNDILFNVLNNIDVNTVKIKDILKTKNSTINIFEQIEDILGKIINYNYIPVQDDRGYFVGIITRKNIINYMIKNYSKK